MKGPDSPLIARRRAVIAGLGVSTDLEDELVGYLDNPYAGSGGAADREATDDEDEPHVAAWRRYAREAMAGSAAKVLTEKLVQLRFEVAPGTSTDASYRAATRRGDMSGVPKEPPAWEDPPSIELLIHPTAGGAVPVVFAAHRGDFERLVRSLAGRNEPIPVPPSMGACLVKGLINQDRVSTWREGLERDRGRALDKEEWSAALREMAPRKDLYQDRVLILSRGPYAGSERQQGDGTLNEQWVRDSTRLRLEHECFHYLTWRRFGLIRSNLLDELLADFTGMIAALGAYDPEAALTFLGVERGAEEAGAHRLLPDARLRLYRGEPELSEAALPALALLAVRASHRLAELTQSLPDREGATRRPELLALAAAGLGIEGWFEPDAPKNLLARLKNLQRKPRETNRLLELRRPADQEGVGACLDGFMSTARARGMSDRLRRRIALTLDEILTNIAKYAYDKGSCGDLWFRLSQPSEDVWRLDFEDAGKPFNPMNQPGPDLGLDALTHREGGLGLWLVRHLSANMRYRRRLDRNHLSIAIRDS